MRGLVRAGWVMGLAWAAIAVGGIIFAEPDSDDRVMIFVFTGIAVAAALSASVLFIRGRVRLGGGALLVAGLCAPTFGLAVLNMLPILVGGILAVRKEPAPSS